MLKFGKLAWFFAIILQYGCRGEFSSDSISISARCSSVTDWSKTVDVPQPLDRHQYTLLEECLYYNLSQINDVKYKKAESLSAYAPTQDADNKILITFQKTIVKSLYISEYSAPTITGSMSVFWNDFRLTWKPSDWKLEALNIKDQKHIWVPDINADKEGPFANTITYRNITVKRNGDISARMDFRTQGQCQTDYVNYPRDVMTCCFDFKSNLYDNTMKFVMLENKGSVNFDRTFNRWNAVELKIALDQDDDGGNVINVCMKVSRNSSTLRMELMLPLAICAILVVVSPLFGSMKRQIYIKLFALLLQFLCFQFIVNRTPDAGFNDTVPKIYQFYEFTLAITMTSLLLTLLLQSCGKSQSKIPPPHWCMLFANALNSRLFCCNPTDSTKGANSEDENAKNASNWEEIFNAINNLLSIIVLSIYIIAAFIYCS